MRRDLAGFQFIMSPPDIKLYYLLPVLFFLISQTQNSKNSGSNRQLLFRYSRIPSSGQRCLRLRKMSNYFVQNNNIFKSRLHWNWTLAGFGFCRKTFWVKQNCPMCACRILDGESGESSRDQVGEQNGQRHGHESWPTHMVQWASSFRNYPCGHGISWQAYNGSWPRINYPLSKLDISFHMSFITHSLCTIHIYINSN